jgi:hypothetical protein
MKTPDNLDILNKLKRAGLPLQRIWPRLPETLIAVCALAIIFLCLVTYVPSVGNYASQLISGNKYLAVADGLLNPFRSHKLLLKSGLPIYDLKIGRQQYAILEQAAEKAEQKGWMSDDLKIWVNARFFSNGQEYNVKIRLRGDLPNHWRGIKKSFRIKFTRQTLNDNGRSFKEKVYFKGKRQINLIIPMDRRYVLSYFINALMREYGLTIPRDQFVILRVNGVLQGLYYEVEHFDKPLLAANRKPETTVFGQNDRVMHFDKYTRYGIPAVADARFDLGSMRRQVDSNGQLAMRAMQVLIDHSLKPSEKNFRRVREVLDWEKYLRFRVITTLCNTNHVRFGSDNLRLYYDTSRGLLEPVPWDLHLTRLPKEPGTIDFWNSHGPDEIQKATLTHPSLRLQRNKILWEMLADGGETLMAKYSEIHERIRPLAWSDVLSIPFQGHKMDKIKADLFYNIKRIHKVLSLSSANLIYRLEADNQAVLEFLSLNFSGISLQQISLTDESTFSGDYQLFEDTNINGRLDDADRLLQTASARNGRIIFEISKTIFPEVEYDSDYLDGGRYWEFYKTLGGRWRLFLQGRLAPLKRMPLEWTPPQIEVSAQNAVTGMALPSAVINQTDAMSNDIMGITAYDASSTFDLAAPHKSRTEFLNAHPEFLASREYEGGVELRGNVTLAGTVIVPKHVPLILKPGANITMEANANILCYGRLVSLGTSSEPVRIHGNSRGDPWGTLAVVRPPETVRVEYTEFRDGGQAVVNGILFTGGFAVHDGDLEIRHSKFTAMQSEDALNLKNGTILMENCEFSSSASDGVDLDFVTGDVRNTRFVDLAGDGLDLSGSKVYVTGSFFKRIGDKGISVGENSHPVIINNLFKSNTIGISTKDLSVARAANCTFVQNKLAIEAKRKKPMFGPGSGEFVNCVFSANIQIVQEDYFSRGGVTIEHSLVDMPLDHQTDNVLVAPIQFAAPDSQNFLLSGTFAGEKAVDLAFPTWYRPTIRTGDVRYPGILTAIGLTQYNPG